MARENRLYPDELRRGVSWGDPKKDIPLSQRLEKEYKIVFEAISQALSNLEGKFEKGQDFKKVPLLAGIRDQDNIMSIYIKTKKPSDFGYSVQEIFRFRNLGILNGLVEAAIIEKRKLGYNLWRAEQYP